MNPARVRRTIALLTALAMVSLVLAAPALAQSSPSAAQYPGSVGGCSQSRGISCIQSLDDGSGAFTENAQQGTGAVNEALGETEASARTASASPGEAPGTASTSPDDAAGGADGAAEGEGLAAIKELPETGGASAAALGSGALLVALGLMVRGIFRA